MSSSVSETVFVTTAVVLVTKRFPPVSLALPLTRSDWSDRPDGVSGKRTARATALIRVPLHSGHTSRSLAQPYQLSSMASALAPR